MKSIGYRAALACAALGLAIGASGRAEAGIVITAIEAGGDVVISGAGTLDLAGATADDSFFGQVGVKADFGYVLVGPPPGDDVDGYMGIDGPGTFGAGNALISASSGSGDLFGFNRFFFGDFFVPAGYVSGDSLSGTATFSGATFSSLGLTPGTYDYTIPSDTITFQIGAVPEPSSLALMGVGGISLMVYGLRRRKARA